MTREEHLYWLNKEIETWENECQSKHPIKEALYVARKVLEQELCEDAVSRKAVRDTIFAECSGTKLDIDFAKVLLLQRAIKTLPSVTPQEHIKGHWIEHPHSCGINWEYPMYECSECHGWTEDDSDFCPNCGVDMREVLEDEIN